MKSFLVVENPATVYADAADAAGLPTGAPLVAGDTPDMLAEGAIGIWTAPSNFSPPGPPQLVLPGNIAALLTNGDIEKFDVYVGRPSSKGGSGVQKTMTISRRGLMKYISSAFSAPVNQVTVVGDDGTGNGSLNFPPVIVEGMIFTVGVVLTRHGSLVQNQFASNQPNERMTFEYITTAADAAAPIADAIGNIVQGWIDELTARQNANDGDPDIYQRINFATLVNGGDVVGLQITAGENEIFEVYRDQEAQEADIQYSDAEFGSTVPTPFNPGNGTGNQIGAMELDWAAHSTGLENIVGPDSRFTPAFQQQRPLYVDRTLTYDTIFIRFRNDFEQKDGMNAVGNKLSRVALATVSGSAAQADLVAILDAIYASV